MRFVIPVAEGKLALHFGHCETFMLIDADDKSGKISQTSSVTPPPHAPGVLPKWLAEQGANVIIAGGMGSRAQGLFSENGIRVIIGAPVDTPDNLVAAFISGSLKTGQNACDH